MRILFTFMGGPGHFYPLLPVARAAEAAGHTVAVASPGGLVAKIEAAGFTAIPTSEKRKPSTTDEPLPEYLPVAPIDLEREERDLREAFARRGTRRQTPAILEVAREWKPDILVRDEVDFGTAIASEVAGIPCVTVIVLSAGGFLRNEVVGEPLHELRAEYGLPADPELTMLTRGLVLSPCAPSFRHPDFPLPGNAFSYREADTVPRRAASQTPNVYFTLGTEFNTVDLHSRVLAGLKDVAANVVVTVGERIDPAEFGPMPDHMRVERFIPQHLILPTCDLVVSHGGSGSVMGTIAHGLPSVLLPMGADQPNNAQRCVDLGTGLALDPVNVTPEEVREAVSRVLADPSYRLAAGRIQDEINALPGVDQTVALLEQLR